MNLDLFNDCIALVEKCLRDANKQKSDVNDVVLVGGSTRIPKVEKLLKFFFEGKELCKSINPDEAVAYGAACHAAVLSGMNNNENSKRDFVLMDVTPLSLGVRLHSGAMSVVVPRNKTIPTKMVRRDYSTAFDNQTTAFFAVYEGERPVAKDNNLLGKVTLNGLPPAPKAYVWFDVCFDIDADGILTVSAEHAGTANKNQITITNHRGRLSKEEIDRMVREAEKYKVEEEERKKASKAKYMLENYVGLMRRSLRGCGKKIGLKEKRKLGDVVEKTTQWMEWNHILDNATKFEDKLKEIESICEPIVAMMHQQQQDGDTNGGATRTVPKIEIVEID